MTENTFQKIIDTVNYITIPCGVIGGIWGFDISVYAAAGCAMISSILTFVKLFLKK